MSEKASDQTMEVGRVDDRRVAAPENEAFPRRMDPVITMAALQRYVEVERERNRRALMWTSVTFLFIVLIVLIAFTAIGIFVVRTSRRAVDLADEIQAQTALYSSEVLSVSRKVGDVEQRHSSIAKEVEAHDADRLKESETLKTDLQRFSQWVADNDRQVVRTASELDARLGALEKAVADKDRELAALRGEYQAFVAAQAAKPAFQADIPSGTDSVLPEDVAGASDTNEAPVSLDRMIEEAFAEERASASAKPVGGISVYEFPNGDRYEGEFEGGLFSGRGVYRYRNGDRYEGEFKSDMKSGKGIFLFHNGDRYAGEFSNDAMNGKGAMLYQNGNKYAGDFADGMKQGNGVLSYFNGDTYKGEFRNDEREGRGTYLFSDGAKYVGNFVNGQRHGQGRYVYASGEEYVGEFKNGRKDGVGVSVYPGGKRVEGTWKDDRPVGGSGREGP